MGVSIRGRTPGTVGRVFGDRESGNDAPTERMNRGWVGGDRQSFAIKGWGVCSFCWQGVFLWGFEFFRGASI